MTLAVVPIVYARPPIPDRLTVPGRALAGAISGACLALLALSAWLTPSPAGVSTHTALGLQRCQFLDRTGLPCPSCGMTTSFSWFARGNVAASLYVQPMGTVLALIVAGTFWGALYSAVTGKPGYRLVQRIPSRYYLIYLPAFAILAWGWKMWIHLHGIDGWH